FTETQGWEFARLAPPWANGSSPIDFPIVSHWGDTNNTNDLVLFYVNSSNVFALDRNACGVATAVSQTAGPFSSNASLGVCGAWTATAVKVSVSGANFTSAANTTIPTLTATSADLGRNTTTAAAWLSGRFLWYATGSGTLTDADAAALNAISGV